MGVGDSCDDDDDDDDDDDNGDDDYVIAELKQQRNDTNKKLGELLFKGKTLRNVRSQA